MTEALIGKLVKLKLDSLAGMVEKLPPEEAATARNLGMAVLDALCEYRQELKVESKEEPDSGVRSIPVE